MASSIYIYIYIYIYIGQRWSTKNAVYDEIKQYQNNINILTWKSKENL